MQYQKLHAGGGREAIILQVMALYSGLLVIKICMYTDSQFMPSSKICFCTLQFMIVMKSRRFAVINLGTIKA